MKCHKSAIAAKIIEHLAKAMWLSHGWLWHLYLESPLEATTERGPFVFYDHRQKYAHPDFDKDIDISTTIASSNVSHVHH